jgi:hypothetical protein
MLEAVFKLRHLGLVQLRRPARARGRRNSLVAGYLGQTAIKARDALERALGGTLFMGEAYSLNVRHDVGAEDFGRRPSKLSLSS